MRGPGSPTALPFHTEDYSPNISQIKEEEVGGRRGTLGGLYDPAVIGSEVSLTVELHIQAPLQAQVHSGRPG